MRLTQDQPRPLSPRPVALIGTGGIVRAGHLPAYRMAGFPVFGAYDLDPAAAVSVAADFGIGRVFQTLRELVQEAPPDAVFDLAVPASAILGILRELPDGAAVLIQKPMGESLAEARAIRDLCQEKRLVAALNFQLRYASYVLAARAAIEAGLVGTLHEMDIRVVVDMPWGLWSFLEAAPRMEINYHSIHYVDLVRSFMGEPTGVYARSIKHHQAPNLEACRSQILLDYGTWKRANIHTNHGHAFGPRHQESFIKWEGDRGAIRATMGLLMDYPAGRPDSLEIWTENTGEWEPVELAGSWFPHGFIGTMGSLMRWAEGGPVAPTAVRDAFHTMAVVEACYASSASGSTAIPD